ETDIQTRGVFSNLKPIQFPKQFPSIRQFMVTGGKIYINTYKTKDNGKQSQFLIFDIKGKFRSGSFVPLMMKSPIQPFPFAIHNNKIYQLVRDDKTKKWTVHITPFK
ncbi:MAG: hypothetical protein GY940_30925, partial [bacterium]|nr:hypothetical protein [bacterium]